jgi:hypothetical protein
MNLVAHSVTAIPFLLVGSYAGAMGAVSADLSWIYAEWKFRRSGIKVWKEWADASITNTLALPYKLAHSVLIVPILCLWFGWYEFLLGWLVHLALDLPTHAGIMRQQPLYPFKWRWPWVIKSFY